VHFTTCCAMSTTRLAVPSLLPAAWALENTCVVYDANGNMGQRMLLLQASQQGSRPSTVIPWPPEHSGSAGARPRRSKQRIFEVDHASQAIRDAVSRTIWYDRTAFAIRLDQDNLWHVRWPRSSDQLLAESQVVVRLRGRCCSRLFRFASGMYLQRLTRCRTSCLTIRTTIQGLSRVATLVSTTWRALPCHRSIDGGVGNCSCAA
jgi:hypothetical protein